jgi:hypothetical protein
MLLLGSKSITVEGIQVFPDHADPNQFWYLPGPVALKRDPTTHEADFTFLKFRPAAVQGGAKGGGFLMFTVDLQPDANLENRILGRVAALAPGEPKLSAVEFDEGTVQCIALNVQGPGGTTAPSGGPTGFNAVEQILGASVPALFGDNAAAFSLTLSQEGATILETSFEDGTQPVGVLYNLKFTGMRPALDVKITADFKRIYDEFSVSVSGQIYWFQLGIDAGFEKLVQDGAIKVEVTNFTGQADLDQKEQWALDFFKQNLLAQWFEPTLLPGQLGAGKATNAAGLDAITRGNSVRPQTPAAPPRPANQPPLQNPRGTPPTEPPTTPPTAPPSTPPPAGPAAPSPTAGSGRGTQPAPNSLRPPAKPAPGAPPHSGTGSPTTPVARPPAAGKGLNFNPQAANNKTNPMGNMSGQSTQFAFKLNIKAIEQQEMKTLTFEYHRSEATQRVYAPQGFFGLLAGDLDRTRGGRHFRDIDLDDPFFRVFGVTVQAPIDYTRLGLTSAHVTLDYGDPQGDPEHLKHQDYLFDAGHKQDQQWQVFMDDRLDTSYAYQVEYHFDPESGWKAQRYDYQLAGKTTENRTLFVNPFDDFGFLEVRVFPNRIDSDVVTATDVHLEYQAANGWSQKDVLTILPGKEAQFWRLRLEDPTATSYTCWMVHHLKDGSTVKTDAVVTSASSIPVDDPFAGAIDLTCVPLLDAGKVRFAFLDFVYDDPANSYHRELRMQFNGDASAAVSQHVSIRDPRKIGFRYRVTVEGKDGQEHRGAYVDTEDTLIAVKGGA